MSSKFLIIKSFSIRHKLQLLISDLPLTRLAMEKLTVGRAPLSFNSQQYFAKSVSVLLGIYYLRDIYFYHYSCIHACLTPRIVYRADVTNNQTQEQKFYYGISDTPFKEWYENHKKSFRHKEYSTETDLAKYCWELKDKGALPTVNFSIATRVNGKSLINNCSLCLSEKLFIIRNLDNINMLNKKSEIISKCRHISKRLLIKVKMIVLIKF